MKNLVLITQLAITMSVPIILGLLLGNYIDKWIGTKWIFSIILLIMGVASGFINSYKLIMSLNSTEKGEKECDRK
ncbi:AtpZ/AtpI family protein [Helcococcus ovis]|uniref:AtpZ/AtpI family protein n=2 Tax=Helcococcus ovis TaxID=72026 RepID=A0A4R9C2F8_9FIRM|nr:AtpZ/AtpI family protein [Helcococcus ovis]TFF64824.1 AtpZ/AtpI family protein [Helcococcus ovis]TFF65856.1 AtpZ/AtpI family protein [Helcococcus ovis]TFF67808.1 AtpZ/AtpI family protein [Helcococcus ovis]WNZ01072.1 AtpZ/AtpI family protein [Helcococcus ovis]